MGGAGNIDAMTKSSNPVESAVVRAASSKVGAWFFIHVTAKVDPWLLKRTNGRFSSILGQPVLLLQHTGARSGLPRETPLVFVNDGDDIILIASMGGAPTNPAWFHNLVAHPDCHVIAKGRSGPYRAHQAEGLERERLWQLALGVYAGYDTYQARTGGRTIPVMVLSPQPQR